MCGIVGFVGKGNAVEAVLAGLESLEYRGYDSAGAAWREGHAIHITKTKGRVADLRALIAEGTSSHAAIGHTRWATHGAPTDCNAHPHASSDGKIVLVHNGIIDNYAQLRRELGDEKFLSETDSEVVAHLIAHEYTGDLLAAVEKVLPRLDGTYALAIVSADDPETFVCARKGSPLALGLAEEATILGSDAVPILPHTNKVVFLDDGQVALCKPGSIRLRQDGKDVEPHVTEISWTAEAAQKGGYKHFMLKEIFEQPAALTELVRQRIKLQDEIPEFNLDGINLPDEYLKKISRIVLVAQGTAYHAGMIGRNLLERTAFIPSYAEYAADFHYRVALTYKSNNSAHERISSCSFNQRNASSS